MKTRTIMAHHVDTHKHSDNFPLICLKKPLKRRSSTIIGNHGPLRTITPSTQWKLSMIGHHGPSCGSTITYEPTPADEDNTLSLIVKSMPSMAITKPFEDFNVYRKETKMFFNVLSRMETLLPGVKIAAVCYWAVEQPIKTIVLEDLKPLGYRNVPREHGLDELHTPLVLKKLAQYHAASMMICEQHPEVWEEFKEPFFTRELMKSDLFQNIFPKNFEEVRNLVATWPGYEAITQKFDKILANLEEIFGDRVSTENDKIKVLSHGDVWISNIMFQFSEGNSIPEDAAFVDFQVCCLSSPGSDLHRFFYTSVQLDVLKNKREELILFYYETFRTTLKNIGYKNIPSKNEVLHEIHRKEFEGLASLCVALPIVCMDPKESHDNSLESLSDEATMKKKQKIMFSSPRLINTLKHCLKRLDDLKVLDV